MTGSAAAAGLAAAAAAWLSVPPPGCWRTFRVVSRWWWVPGVAVAVLVVPRAPAVVCLLTALTGMGATRLWRRRAAARLADRNAALMAEVCDVLAAELAAGRPAEAALDEVATVWPALRSVAEASRLGGDVPAALRECAGIPGADGLRLLAAAWAVSRRTGGSLSAAASRVAGAVRRDQATRRLVDGELASARATSRLVAALPLVALLMGSGAGAGPWSFLLQTPGGWACLAAGLGVGWCGLWWIEAIAREARR